MDTTGSSDDKKKIDERASMHARTVERGRSIKLEKRRGDTNLNNEQTLREIGLAFKKTVQVKNRRYRLKTYDNVFLGREAIDCLVGITGVKSRDDAIEIGRTLASEYRLFEHATKDHELKDEDLFYSFVKKSSIDDDEDDEEDNDNKLNSNKINILSNNNKKLTLCDIKDAFESGMQVKDHTYYFRTYKNCFVGSNAVDFMVSCRFVSTRPEAVQLGRKLVNTYNLFEHVHREHDFKDENLFYRFVDRRQRYACIDDCLSTFEAYRMVVDTDNDDNDDESATGSSISSSSYNSGIESLREIACSFQRFVEVKDRSYMLKNYKSVFIGSDAVDYLLLSSSSVSCRKEAVALGQELQQKFNLFQHVTGDHDFQDSYLFYRFTPNYNISNCSITSKNELSLEEIAQEFEKKCRVKDHYYHLKQYPQTFVGSKAVDFLVMSEIANSRRDAVRIGSKLSKELGLFLPANDQPAFVERDSWDSSRRSTERQDTIVLMDDDHIYYEFVPLKERELFVSSATSNNNMDLAASTAGTSWFDQIATIFRTGVKVKTHVVGGTEYKRTFAGNEAIEFLVNSDICQNRRSALHLGRRLGKEKNLFRHITKENELLKDDSLLYRFTDEETYEVSFKTDPSSNFFTNAIPMIKIAETFRSRMKVKDHRYHMKVYKDTFTGVEAVDFLVGTTIADSRIHAVEIGRQLENEFHLFKHVTQDHEFNDKPYFYHFEGSGPDNTHYMLEETDEEEADVTIDIEVRKLKKIGIELEKNLPIKVHKKGLVIYKDSFTGTDAVDLLLDFKYAKSRKEAVQICRALERTFHFLQEALFGRRFQDGDDLFYSITKIDERVEWMDDDSQSDTKAEYFSYDVMSEDEEWVEKVNLFVKKTIQKKSETRSKKNNQPTDGDPLTKENSIVSKKWSSMYKWSTMYKRSTIHRLSTIHKRLTEESTQSVVSKKLSTIYKLLLENIEEDEQLSASTFRLWTSDFVRLDPRRLILDYFEDVGMVGGQLGEFSNTKNMDPDKFHPLLHYINRASVFTVWRPTSSDSIRQMILGEAVGKGLDIKGKSAKRGKLSGFIPFLQINENNHKKECKIQPKVGTVRVFFPGRGGITGKRSRAYAVQKLESVAEDMIRTVEQARHTLSSLATFVRSNRDVFNDVRDSMLLDMENPAIEMIDDYCPEAYGIEIPLRLFWEAYFVRQDISRTRGSIYDTGRPSIPAFQELNFMALRKTTVEGSPRPVIYQNADSDSPMNPFELLMAYEENGRVRRVVSDFDCFLVGTRRVNFSLPFPNEQLDVLKWCTSQIESILEKNANNNDSSGASWTSNWIETISKQTYHPVTPNIGFGDPKSTSVMANAISRLNLTGAVRHGAESFNFVFPQDLDEQFLVVSDTIPGNVRWKYVDIDGLLDFLSEKINEGYTFPLNPKWILVDGGRWAALYDKLMASNNPNTIDSMNVWFPPESGLREQIARLRISYPRGIHSTLPSPVG